MTHVRMYRQTSEYYDIININSKYYSGGCMGAVLF